MLTTVVVPIDTMFLYLSLRNRLRGSMSGSYPRFGRSFAKSTDLRLLVSLQRQALTLEALWQEGMP